MERGPGGKFARRAAGEAPPEAPLHPLAVRPGETLDSYPWLPPSTPQRPPVDEPGAEPPGLAELPPAPAGWQPMSMAPKDKPVLLAAYRPYSQQVEVHVGAWRGGYWAHIVSVDGDPRSEATDPIGWMEVPAPPSAAEAAALAEAAREADRRRRELDEAAHAEMVRRAAAKARELAVAPIDRPLPPGYGTRHGVPSPAWWPGRELVPGTREADERAAKAAFLASLR